MDSSVPPLPPGLRAHVDKLACADILKSIPNWASLRLSVVLTQYLAGCIKVKHSNATRAERDATTVDILLKTFLLTDAEIEIVKSQLAFLRDNKMIPKIGKLRRLYRSVIGMPSKKG